MNERLWNILVDSFPKLLEYGLKVTIPLTVLSFALALTVLDKEKDDKHIFDLASGGFSSTARLAKSNADMWVPIFENNRENLLPVIDAYSDYLSQFRSAVASANGPKLRSLIEDANRIQKIIP